jgi:hypothetical protein
MFPRPRNFITAIFTELTVLAIPWENMLAGDFVVGVGLAIAD